MSDCKYGDPACPCQDGDTCHYEGENPMTPPYTLTPNSGGWNCTSADGKIEVYGRTQEEAKMRMKLLRNGRQRRIANMPPFKVITKEPKDMSEAELQDLATFPASVYPITYGRAYRLILDRLAAEKLRADTLATYLGEHAYVINCGSCIMLLERTPEEWAALVLGGKEQK